MNMEKNMLSYLFFVVIIKMCRNHNDSCRCFTYGSLLLITWNTTLLNHQVYMYFSVIYVTVCSALLKIKAALIIRNVITTFHFFWTKKISFKMQNGFSCIAFRFFRRFSVFLNSDFLGISWQMLGVFMTFFGISMTIFVLFFDLFLIFFI